MTSLMDVEMTKQRSKPVECPRCGEDTPGRSKYCRDCGTHLSFWSRCNPLLKIYLQTTGVLLVAAYSVGGLLLGLVYLKGVSFSPGKPVIGFALVTHACPLGAVALLAALTNPPKNGAKGED